MPTLRLLALLLATAMLMPFAGASAVPAGTLRGLAGGSQSEVEITGQASDEHGNEMTSLFVVSFDGTLIDLNVCRPAGASAANPVPVVLSSHGWGGQKQDCLGKTAYFNAGLGFASMTQRGNGESGGENNVMDPDYEGRDIMAVIDHLAALDWVAKDDGPGGNDPVLGGQGGSYGGGFQWVGAFTDQHLRGAPTRFNTLNASNTWYDLRTALAPNDVMRTLIVGGLYAGGVQNNNLAPWIHASMTTALATGQIIDGPDPADFASELHQHGAAWFVQQGERLDIPVRLRQGAGDLVFNLNEAMHAFDRALTPGARARSILANHHGGHGLPGQLPSGPLPYTSLTGDVCPLPGDLAWFRHTLLGEELDLGSRLRLRTVDGACHPLDDFPSATTLDVDGLDGAAIPVGPRGQAQMHSLLTGPATVAGAPSLSFTATGTVPDARLFWGLAVGTGPDDAALVDAQWTPTRFELPSVAAQAHTELGAVVAEIEQGEQLFLVVSPAADQFAAHSSRVPGVVLLDDVQVDLPLL